MDEKTRTSAIEKADSMIKFVAYPDELRDDDKIEEYYQKLSFKNDDYLSQIYDACLFRFIDSYGRLNKPVNKSDWTERSISTEVNAFYSPSQNFIGKSLVNFLTIVVDK